MVGGVETYLSNILPEMHSAGYELALWTEVDAPENRERIATPQGVPSWCVGELGEESALAKLREWKPDLLYVHKVAEPRIEVKLLQFAPSVFFAHDYYGTCISGLKTNKSPQVMPCSRRFGWRCLLHYYPHRCGGWNPATMLKLYKMQSERLGNLSNYNAVVTLSEHLKTEYIRHGIDASRTYNLNHFAHTPDSETSEAVKAIDSNERKTKNGTAGCKSLHAITEGRTNRLLFVGRMDDLKGGCVLLDAVLQVQANLQRSLHIKFAGDGAARALWERHAAKIKSQTDKLTVEFSGWLSKPEVAALWDETDLLVVPSLWPEPFGLVGVEAGLHGVPVAAFDVGGISTWLTNGENGYLASGTPPTAAGLAEAIIKCLKDPKIYSRLSANAINMARRFSVNDHLKALSLLFNRVLQTSFSAN